MLSHVAVATDGGLALFDIREMNLEQKYNIIEKDIIYFRSPTPDPHPYAGYLVGDVGFASYGNWSSYIPRSNDNNGLWTAVYLSGEIFRYAITKDPKVKENAWKYFEGMEFLNHVTGIRGLPARSVLYGVPPPTPQWRRSTTKPGWIWKSDTSSDEMVGHLMAYPLVYYLLAETASEKQRAYTLVDDITRYIVNNGFTLIDWTGRPTTWGHWDPPTLNGNFSWDDERGVNAVQILSWLYSAYGMTGDDIYKSAYEDLTNRHGYHINIINAKIIEATDINYSDDELLYMGYFPYLFAEQIHRHQPLFSPSLAPYFGPSITRAQRTVGLYRPYPWNAIYYYWKTAFGTQGEKSSENTAADILLAEESAKTMREWPVEQIHWSVNNTGRLDLHFRQSNSDALELIPYSEQPVERWNSDRFETNRASGNGYSAADPGAFSLAYWSCRWVGLGV